ncbi:hypothetical protein SRABI26_00333 [Arthrobacter sp. Bi26]|uniref:hypothetical protein n=1 Tax=Arthrobacter sp. Bi26 TaxID=2822350 RepID=UPI001E09F2D5|nr:hypothetical protein [Arthrobacter sp. Bi26]CAH0135464.1 hypothetical protein SRABI26_00333 [Arthrobacter sp. Bi26]
MTISTGTARCVELAGTTTFTKEAVGALADRHSLGIRGYYEGPAQLQLEPDNPADPHAIAVLVEGEKVGYLPFPANRGTGLKPGASAPATYQLHVLREAKLKAKAFVWLGDGPPEWDHTEDNPPGLTTAERANEAHRDRSAMVREALTGGGARAAQFERGMVDGVHYLELIEPIKQLNRDGRLEEALVLCYKAITAAEGDAGGREPAPGYTEQAAIIHRKLSQKDEEIAVLKRWLAKCPKARRNGSRIAERLAKLEAAS